MSALVKHATDPRPMPGEAVAAQYLTFMLHGETYGLAIDGIREIIEFGQLTTVPMMPCFIRGVMNLRGAAIPVVDLSSRFGIPPAAVTRRTCIVVLEVAEGDRAEAVTHVIGVVVDAVNEVVEIGRDDVEPPPAFGGHLRSDFVAGMGRQEGRFVVLLDPRRVLSIDEMSQLARSADIGGTT